MFFSIEKGRKTTQKNDVKNSFFVVIDISFISLPLRSKLIA
jgi:hypothetical protein